MRQLKKLLTYGTKIFRTDESGEIEINVNKQGKYNITKHITK